MIYDRILVRYGDLTLKGRTQNMFLKKVQNLTRSKLKDLNVSIDCTHSRIYVLLNGVDYKEVLKRLDLVSGLSSYSLVCRCDSNIESINDLALKLVKETITKPVTFKVECKRAYKTFPLTSLEVPKVTSAHILKNTNNLTDENTKLKKNLKSKIKTLSPRQREIILQLLKSEDKTIALDKNSGDTIYLLNNLFLHMPQQVVSVGWNNEMILTYAPQPWLLELYNEEPDLFI